MADIELSDEQKDSINKIRDWSQTLGLDPSFSLAIAYPESAAKHVPADDPSSTAYGPFQVNRATAAANGIDYDDMTKNKDLAIWAGLKNLQRHAENPSLKGDPSRIIAAHRLGEGSAYAKTGDPEDIPPELASFFRDVGSVYGDALPKSVYAPPAPYSHEGTRRPPAEGSSSPPGRDTTLPERIIGGAAGAGTALVVPAKVYNWLAPFLGTQAQMRTANALSRMSARGAAPNGIPAVTAGGPLGDASGLNAAADALASNAPKKGGPFGWLNGDGRTTEYTRVPDALVANVATLKGQGPASVSYAEAQNAANVEKALAIGEPPTKWVAQPGGTVLQSTAPATTGARSYSTAPPVTVPTAPTPIGSQVGQGTVGGKTVVPPVPTRSLSDRVTAAYDRALYDIGNNSFSQFLKHPLTRLTAGGFGIGASLPEILEDIRVNPTVDTAAPAVAIDVAKGAGFGVLPTVLPQIIQKGLSKTVPPLSAAMQEYEAYKRLQAGDTTGSVISGVGGLASLAPLLVGAGLLSNPVWWGVGATGMLAPPLINYLRDTYGTKP